ncbi:MAG: hypothetical protein K1060chlam2_01147 [Chlamydiae bacterium]|nr:hypothetical protein [Chlamydiota bacterium]
MSVSMSVSSRQIECVSSLVLIALTTTLATSRFRVINTRAILFSGTLTAGAVLTGEYFVSNDFRRTLLKCFLIFELALITPMITKLLFGERFLLKIRSSFSIGALNLGIVVFTYIFCHGIKRVLSAPPPHPVHIRLSIIRKDLKEHPVEHLKTISRDVQKKFKKIGKPCQIYLKLAVVYVGEEGVDGGGLTRNFLNSLFNALKERQDMFQVNKNRLALPYNQTDDQSSFVEIGRVLMSINHVPPKNKCYIGQHFDNALFNVIFTLTAQEIDTPYKELSLNSKLKMAYALYAVDEDAKFMKELLVLIGKDSHLSEEESKTAKALLTYSKSETLRELFFTEYNGDQRLAPIHAIAQGMKEFSLFSADKKSVNRYWDNFSKQPNQSWIFNERVQGVLDRKALCKCIRISSQVSAYVRIRANWIKKWIRESPPNGATESELRQFLKFITGSTSNPPEGKAIYLSQLNSDQVDNKGIGFLGSTCAFTLFLSYLPIGSDYEAEKAFIVRLKASISGDSKFGVK